MKSVLFITFFIIFSVVQHAYSDSEGRLCFRSTITVGHIQEELSDENEDGLDSDVGEYSEGMKMGTDPETGSQYVQCSPQTLHCYALWKEDPLGNGTVIIGQGCWESSGKQDCERNQCVSDKKPPKAMNNTKFCCCSGDFCNVNISNIYVPVVEEGPLPPMTGHLDQQSYDRQIFVWSVGVCSLLFVFIAAVLVYHVWQARRASLDNAKGPPHPDQVYLMTPGFSTGLYSVDHLKLCSIVGQGRYGSVWKGLVNEQEVAVKIFPAHYKSYFYNERDIYCLPFMENPALLTYYGCDERTNLEGHAEYLLVLSYCPTGCLQDYLNENVLDFQTFCKMASSVAKGLAHLHTDLIKGDKIKPCVSHRDLNSRNILVKSDMSCCICDLGFAMRISNPRYFANGEEQHAETISITEVGTRRYMAPEVLEGAVNLRDCETSLKQIDVYALGLVLWELATRCSEFYNGVEPPVYKLPFQQEIGLHPTLEQMQALVSRRKARPLFPVQWRDTAAARLIRDTAEDCWDQDAEARLTALCVEERLYELPLLKDRHNRATIYATSPTFNSGQPNGNIINNNNHLNIGNSGNSTGGSFENNPNHIVVIIPNSTGKDAMYDISDGTVETLLSPSDPGETPIFKNSNQTGLMNQFKHEMVCAPLQPYQGRNPCLERNLMLPTDSTDNLQYNSNLVEKSFKHTAHYRSNSNALESQGLISHDYLGYAGNGYNSSLIPANRPITPIPYVQNVNLPKQHNIPVVPPNPPKPSSKFKWRGLRNLIDKKIFGRERLEPLPNEEEAKSNLISDVLLLKKSAEPMVLNTQVNLVSSKNLNGVVTSVLHENSSGSSHSASSSNSTSSTRSKSSSGGSKRPSTLPLVGKSQTKSAEQDNKKSIVKSDSNPVPKQRLSIVQTPNNEDDKTGTIKISDSTSGISQIMKRKNSLCKQQSLDQFTEVFSSTSDLSRLKDPNQRIKTPGDVPPSVRRTRGKVSAVTRFSLYDDRMMSFDHWSSVPDDMDITVETTPTATGPSPKPSEVETLKCNADSVRDRKSVV